LHHTEALQEALEQAFTPSRNTFHVSIDSQRMSQSSIAEYVRLADQQLPLSSTNTKTSQASVESNRCEEDDTGSIVEVMPSAVMGAPSCTDVVAGSVVESSEGDAESRAFEAWLHGDTPDHKDKTDIYGVDVDTEGDEDRADGGGHAEVAPCQETRERKKRRVVTSSGSSDDSGMDETWGEGVEEEEEGECIPRVNDIKRATTRNGASAGEWVGRVEKDRRKRTVLDVYGKDICSEEEDEDEDEDEEEEEEEGVALQKRVHLPEAAVKQPQLPNKWTFDPKQVLRHVKSECAPVLAAVCTKGGSPVAESDGAESVSKGLCSLERATDQVQADAALMRIIHKEVGLTMTMMCVLSITTSGCT
jgi:hypothetical protein